MLIIFLKMTRKKMELKPEHRLKQTTVQQKHPTHHTGIGSLKHYKQIKENKL